MGVSLRPVQGSDREIVDDLRGWLKHQPEPEPLIIETSGSTGIPKRVVLSRRAIEASVSATTRRLGAEGVWLLTLPASYVAGLQVIARSLLAGHEPVLVDEHGSFAAAYDAAYSSAPDLPRFTSLVSAQISRLLDDPADLAALQGCHTVLLGGGPIDPGARRRAEQSGVNCVATYGSSETSGGCVYDGVPLAGVDLDLSDDGQIKIAGPMLFEGYDGDVALTETVLKEGWLNTSDRGEFDDRGRLRVVGRIDDVIISGGVKVPASAVAARLREHVEIAQAEVYGVPDERWGERVVAAVVVSVVSRRSLLNHQDPDALVNERAGLAHLRDFVAEALPRTWAPHQWVIVDELPLTPSGKPDRPALRALAEARSVRKVTGGGG